MSDDLPCCPVCGREVGGPPGDCAICPPPVAPNRPQQTQPVVVARDSRVGWVMVDGPQGSRWVRDRDRLGWGLDRAYDRWRPEDEADYLRALARYDRCADCWMRGDMRGMMLAYAGPAPLVALQGGLDG